MKNEPTYPFPKILITGTGRAGTTLLVRLLTALGFDTGFDQNSYFDPISKGGLETHLKNPHNQTLICKNPKFAHQLPRLNNWYDIRLVLVPIRELEQAAASRVSLGAGQWGGLWNANNQTEQEAFYQHLIYQLSLDCAALDLPVKFIHFPRFVEDFEYLWRYIQAINAIAENPNLTRELFDQVCSVLVDQTAISQH